MSTAVKEVTRKAREIRRHLLPGDGGTAKTMLPAERPLCPLAEVLEHAVRAS